MIETKKTLSLDIVNAAKAVFGDSDLTDETVFEMLEYPPDRTMGDLALPCFKLSRTFRRSPVEIASKLAEKIESSVISSAVALNGYLNFKISKDYFAGKIVKRILSEKEKYGGSNEGNGKTVVLDYSSPNVAKPFHIGHLGTTVIGHSLKKLHEFAGYKCVGINYLGDWGTQFGKLIVAYRKWGDKQLIEDGGIDKLVELYVKFHEEAEKDDTLNDEARAEFHKLESQDPENIALWKWFLQISLAEYSKTYKQLGIEFDLYSGESYFYGDKKDLPIQILKDKGLLKIDDGASIVDLSEYNMPPCLILKSDGSSIYAIRDIASAFWRKSEFNFDKSIYVTSAGQSVHFAQFFKVIELMGMEWAKQLVHVPYGTVSINGSKLATRTGNVILLKDLFAMAIDKVSSVILEKNPDLENKEEVAENVGVGAIVFYYLSNNRIRDINFMLEDALSFEGNTGPYVQYTYARTCSILSKAGEFDESKVTISCDEENDLVQTLSRFPEKVNEAIEQYEPSVITRYILELAGSFNRFYHNCKILGAETQDIVNTRLTLTKAVNITLKNALELICMKAPEKI